MRSLLPSVVVTVLLGLLAATAVTFGLTWLILRVPPNGTLPEPAPGSQVNLLDILRVALTVAAGIGGAVALVAAYRRQSHLEADDAGKRSRYTSAAQQLGDRHPAVRLAGVYAMANLVDEWTDQRQQCVDVLCAYLRIPWTWNEQRDLPSSRTVETTTDHSKIVESYDILQGEGEVRRTLLRVVLSHLREGGSGDWRDLTFDFTNATIPYADFAGISFTGGDLLFDRATFIDHVSFRGARFGSDFNVSFEGATFNRDADFSNAVFGLEAKFAGATFCGNATFVGAELTYGEAHFEHCRFRGPETTFDSLNLPNGGGMINFDHARFESRSTTFEQLDVSVEEWYFNEIEVIGQLFSLERSSIRAEHLVYEGSKFAGNLTSFAGCELRGWNTSFADCTFSGDLVLFEDADISSGENLQFTNVIFSGQLLICDRLTVSKWFTADESEFGARIQAFQDSSFPANAFSAARTPPPADLLSSVHFYPVDDS